MADFDPLLNPAFQFRPIPIWDPVPEWITQRLNPEAIQRLAVIQLEKQGRMLEAQQAALKDTIEAVRGMSV